MSVFSSIQDGDLVRSIAKASSRLVYMAPGVSLAIADAIKTQIQRQHLKQIAIIIDGDEECCRLGYGDAVALESLTTDAQGQVFPCDDMPVCASGCSWLTTRC